MIKNNIKFIFYYYNDFFMINNHQGKVNIIQINNTNTKYIFYENNLFMKNKNWLK